MSAFAKPQRGSALIERRTRRAALVAHEHNAMRAAKTRDGNKCRWPRCEFVSLKLPIDACHVVKHRGMGGDPKGTRTECHLIMALCRAHHGRIDTGELDIQPQTTQGTDGPCDFLALDSSGRMMIIASDKTIGISVERGR